MATRKLFYIYEYLNGTTVNSHKDNYIYKYYCIVFVFVLMGWSLLPNALRPFKIYCAPPKLALLGREYAD